MSGAVPLLPIIYAFMPVDRNDFTSALKNYKASQYNKL
jgi:hypothetical protein